VVVDMSKDIITRATWRNLAKHKNRDRFNEWLQDFGCEMYNDGCRDAAAAEITALRDEFGFGTNRIARFMQKRDSVIQAINAREFTALDIIEELRTEGLKIKTDFEWTYNKEAK